MKKRVRDLLRWLPGTVISVLLVAAILRFVDLRATVTAIQGARYRMLAPVMGLSLLWILVRAKVWLILLRGKPSYRDVLFSAGEGYLLNAFLPLRLGELGRVFLLSRKSGMQFGEVLPTVVIERAVDLAIAAALFLAALPVVVGASGANKIGYVVGSLVVAGLVVMFVLARHNLWALRSFHALSARRPRLQSFGGSFLESFLAGLAVLTDVRQFCRFLLWMLANWSLSLLAYWLMVRAYFPQGNLVWAMFALSAAAFGGALPSAPGAIGTFEGAVAAALTMLSGDQSASLAVALTARVYNYLNTGVIGGIGLARDGVTLSDVYRQLRNFRAGSERR